MKNIVVTTGPFMLVDPYTKEEVSPHRPHVMTASPFLDTRIGNGQLKLIEGNLPLEADDAEFANFWKENEKVAVDAFLSTFKVEEEKPKKQTQKAKAPSKTEE